MVKERLPGADSLAAIAWPIVGIGVLLALLLALPGQTLSAKYLNDLFIFLDGVHRIHSGQVPNVDFHSSLGPLAYYLPAAGYGISGGFAGAMPWGMALVVLALAPVAAWLIGTRMRAVIGIPLAGFLLLIAAVPMNPGESVRELSFAMFYNRIGWSALGLLLVLYLPPLAPRRGQEILDATCAAFLVLLMAYSKISYGVVGLAFLAFLLGGRDQRRGAALALVLCLLAGLLIELFWGGTGGYLADIRLAGAVSGDFPTLRMLSVTLLRNLGDIVVYALFALLLLACRRRLLDFLFLGFCAGAGVLLLEQNFQIRGILTLGAGAAVAAEALARGAGSPHVAPRLPALAARGLPLVLIAFLLPVAAQSGVALGLHGALALTRQGDQVPLPAFSGIRLVRVWEDGAYPNLARYNETLGNGVEALEGLPQPAGRLLVLDFVGPFSAGLGLAPPEGDSPWYHWGRTLNDGSFPDPEALFARVEVVMEPKRPIEYWTAAGMRRVYEDHLADHYALARETPYWRIYRARTPEDARASLPSTSSRTTRQSTSAQP